MKKKRNKKKPKMTDIDLMNNFMKSLLSHPEEEVPVVAPALKTQPSTQSAQNNQNHNQPKRRPQNDKHKKQGQEEVKAEPSADVREDLKKTTTNQPQQADNKALAGNKPNLTQVVVLDPESPIFITKPSSKHQNASRSAQRRYTEDNASMLLISSQSQDDQYCAQSYQDEVSEKPLQKNKKKGAG